MPARVAGRGNYQQLIVPIELPLALNGPLDPKSFRSIIGVHYPLASEGLGKPGVIGDVVAMSQEHLADAAHGLDPFDQLGGKPWRIYQHVSASGCGPDNQVTPGSKARLRSKAAEVNVFSDRRRKGFDAGTEIMCDGCADGCSWAGH